MEQPNPEMTTNIDWNDSSHIDLSLYDDLSSKMNMFEDWSDASEQILLEPYRYLLSNPGKEIRTALIDSFNVWLCVPQENLSVVKSLVRLLHSASLLIDDVEDDSDLRRGNPVAHKIYGIPQTLNSANYLMFLAYQEINKLSNVDLPLPDIYRMVNEELLNLHRGQGMDIYWRDNLVCPTEKEYLTMVNNKTGGLFRIAIKLMLLCSPKREEFDLIPLVNLLGVIFQIRDDYSNLCSSTYSENKGFCEDITEGKFSFPIVHGIRADQSNRGLINILRQKTDQREVKDWVVKYLDEKTSSFEYTRKVLDSLLKQAYSQVEKAGGNPALDAIIAKFRVDGTETSKQ